MYHRLKGWDAWEWAAVEGADVAIKVLHPDVRRDVLMDLDLLSALASQLGSLPSLSFLAPSAIVAEFSDAMLMQLDLRREAENLQRFRVNFAGASAYTLRGRISFPEPIEPFISESVLVESFIKGRPVGEYLSADGEAKVSHFPFPQSQPIFPTCHTFHFSYLHHRVLVNSTKAYPRGEANVSHFPLPHMSQHIISNKYHRILLLNFDKAGP